jgi:hypothetical protein
VRAEYCTPGGWADEELVCTAVGCITPLPVAHPFPAASKQAPWQRLLPSRLRVAVCVCPTHNGHAFIHVWTVWAVEELAGVRVGWVVHNVVSHHDHNVVLLDAATPQHLVRLQCARWSIGLSK